MQSKKKNVSLFKKKMQELTCCGFDRDGIDLNNITIYNANDFFKTCKREVGRMGLCEKHLVELNIEPYWNLLPDNFKALGFFLANPDKYPVTIFELCFLKLQINYETISKLLLDPTFFWLLTDTYFAQLIICKFKTIAKKPEDNNDLTFTFVLDSICEILPWLMNGNENLDALNVSYDEMLKIKWSKLYDIVLHGFFLLLGGSGLPRIFKSFSCFWRNSWETRILFWLEFYKRENLSFDFSMASDLLLKLVDSVQIVANFSITDTTSSEYLLENLADTLNLLK